MFITGSVRKKRGGLSANVFLPINIPTAKAQIVENIDVDIPFASLRRVKTALEGGNSKSEKFILFLGGCPGNRRTFTDDGRDWRFIISCSADKAWDIMGTCAKGILFIAFSKRAPACIEWALNDDSPSNSGVRFVSGSSEFRMATGTFEPS